MRKILAPLMFAAALLFSPVALADVSEETWAALEGKPVLLTNPQGKEIRGTLLDADGDTVRIERADGTVVTVGKSEVDSARSLAVGTTDRKADPSESTETPSTGEETVGATERKPAQGDDTDAQDSEPGEATRKDAPPPATSGDTSSGDTASTSGDQGTSAEQDAIIGEVDGRTAAQQKSMLAPAAVGLGCGAAAGFAGVSCCWVPCLAAVGAPAAFAILPANDHSVQGSEAYVYSYQEAYENELRKRRVIWSSVGAVGGLVVGGSAAILIWSGASTATIPTQEF